ncbi:MAG: threonine synthase [Sulfolobales archaeon]|nr:threonine synthase [Sulfolobales archaeon]
MICDCSGLLRIKLNEFSQDISWDLFRRRKFNMWRYRELIPLPVDAEIVTLNEGGTPLVKANNLGRMLGVEELYMKYEGSNPTGSFKDRGMSVGVSIAKYLGVKAVVCASTGNTSSSMAAYASKAGIKPILVVPRNGVAKGKMGQAVLFGGTVIEVGGNFDLAMKIIMNLAKDLKVYPLNSINPWRIEGQKTVAYEIVDELGVPDWISLPVGNAGNITSLWKGLKELKTLGLIDKLPKILAVQAEGASPIAKAFRDGNYVPQPKVETVASAIKIGNPVHWERALNVLKESKGVALTVTDSEIIGAQRELARKEGLGVEPASAAAVAGVYKALELGVVDRGESLVAILTGTALKDPESAASHDVEYLESENEEVAVKIINKLVNGV